MIVFDVYMNKYHTVNSPSIKPTWKLWPERYMNPLHSLHTELSFSRGCSNSEHFLKSVFLKWKLFNICNFLELNAKFCQDQLIQKIIITLSVHDVTI